MRDGLSQRMAQGSVVKCMAVYERPFWRERGLSGAVTSVSGPVSVGFDNSPPDGTPGVLLGFLEGRAAREAADLSRDERRRIVAECFGRLFGPEAARRSTTSTAPGAPMRGRAAATAASCRRRLERLRRRPAASRSARSTGPGPRRPTVWNGYMDGAVGSGQQAARAALARL